MCKCCQDCHFRDGKRENEPEIFLHNVTKKFTYTSPEKRKRREQRVVVQEHLEGLPAKHRQGYFEPDVSSPPSEMEICLESCYWHLIEKRYCFDEDIALYQEPLGKEEKNNNMFDNMAFYDSVSVIAGRAIVTIDPLPERARDSDQPVILQPRRLRWEEQMARNETRNENVTLRKEPVVLVEKSSDEGTSSDSQERMIKDDEETKEEAKEVTNRKTVSFENAEKEAEDKPKPAPTSTHTRNLTVPEVEIRKKSLRERRMSKSLYLKIDFPKELPVIRQNSMPKFFLDTPEHNQSESTLFRGTLTSLQSPMVPSEEFSYDLYSVVQIEKTKNQSAPKEIVPIHRESSRLALIKEKIKLKKSKSTVSASNIPHSNYI